MALIIEDGSIVAGANSFTTDVELSAYALARGVTLPATEAERDVLQIKAVDYFFSIEEDLKGQRTSPTTQGLPYPRKNVYLYGSLVGSNSIPVNWKNAQMELAIQVYTSPLFIDEQVSNVASEKVDVLEVSYFSGGSWAQVRTDSANAYLAPLMNAQNGLMTRAPR